MPKKKEWETIDKNKICKNNWSHWSIYEALPMQWQNLNGLNCLLLFKCLYMIIEFDVSWICLPIFNVTGKQLVASLVLPTQLNKGLFTWFIQYFEMFNRWATETRPNLFAAVR